MLKLLKHLLNVGLNSKILCKIELLPQLLVPQRIVIGLIFKLSKSLNPLKFFREMVSNHWSQVKVLKDLSRV